MLTIEDLEAADAHGRAVAVVHAAGARDPRRLNEAWRAGQGAALRWLRTAASLTLEEVATIVGANGRAVVHAWEQGQALAPLDMLLKLAVHYGFPAGRFCVVGLPTIGETRDPLAARDPWAVK